MAKTKKPKEFPPVPHRVVILKVPSGEIAMETGAEGTYLRFDCDCEHAIPYCKAMCCSLATIQVEEDEIEALEKARKKAGFQLPIIQGNSDGNQEMIRDSDNWCRCLDRTTRACKVYEGRPRTCSDFHCTRGEDARGWLLDLNRHDSVERSN
jgi:hypothetical protein